VQQHCGCHPKQCQTALARPHLAPRRAQEAVVQRQEGADAALLEVQRKAVRRLRPRRLPVVRDRPDPPCVHVLLVFLHRCAESPQVEAVFRSLRVM